ncbi:MAG: pca operon transcription factor PcaQ [Rhizobiaceae bacterium]|nr:pca operon transcription factor PcaQ [Rhizobiaceae bacterium]|tara:strand:+ start:155959 stop:156882 length:924 start_codon:yes stop_codon:yes gene_type:complete
MNLLRRIKLRHLETFVEVARQKSVSRAAESLHLTQPAVTRTIRELEEICGKPLIEREGRGIRISNYGEVFLRHAGSSLASARNGINALAELNLADGPNIRLGALPTVSTTIIPTAVSRYLSSGMRNRLKIVTGENRALLDQLRMGELDLVMGRLPAPENMQGLIFEPLFRDKVIFAVDAHHPLAGKKRFTVDALNNYPVLVPTKQSIIRPFVDRLFIEQGITEPLKVIETVSDSFGRAFVSKHQAIWIISRGVVSAEIADGSFVTLPIDTDSTMGSVGLITKAQSALSSAGDYFADILRKVVAQAHP